jgi:tRNA U34 5-carboxymethylaminomethyl modifying GTPase MnmE/TrmE
MGIFNDFWVKLKKIVDGKEVIILGQRSTGKTTLLNYLARFEIPIDPKQTSTVERIQKKKNKQLKQLGWKVRLANTQKDYGGVTGDYTAWLSGIETADIMIYLFKIDEWLSTPETVEAQLDKDLVNIKKGLAIKAIPVFIIGTHFDLYESVFGNSEEERRKLIDEIKGEGFIKSMKAVLDNEVRTSHILIGSLKTETDMQEIVKQMAEWV